MKQDFNTEQRILVTLAPKRMKKGVLVDADIEAGSRKATVTDGDVVIVELDPVEDKRFYIQPGTLGTYAVSVEADADLGTGITTISDSITGNLTAPQADQLGASAVVEDLPEA